MKPTKIQQFLCDICHQPYYRRPSQMRGQYGFCSTKCMYESKTKFNDRAKGLRTKTPKEDRLVLHTLRDYLHKIPVEAVAESEEDILHAEVQGFSRNKTRNKSVRRMRDDGSEEANRRAPKQSLLHRM